MPVVYESYTREEWEARLERVMEANGFVRVDKKRPSAAGTRQTA